VTAKARKATIVESANASLGVILKRFTALTTLLPDMLHRETTYPYGKSKTESFQTTFLKGIRQYREVSHNMALAN
jgi:hypothetical protein